MHGNLPTAGTRATGSWQGDGTASSKIGAGQRLPIVQQILDGAGMYDAAAVLTSTWADVDRPVRRLDRFLVVFHNDQGVAQIPEAQQSLDQAPVVPLVQPDAGLVEHIEDPDKSRTDLRGEPDSLCLPA